MESKESLKIKRIAQEEKPISTRRKQNEIPLVASDVQMFRLITTLLLARKAVELTERINPNKRVRKLRCLVLASVNIVWCHLPNEKHIQNKAQGVYSLIEKNTSRGDVLCARALLFVCSMHANHLQPHTHEKHIKSHLANMESSMLEMFKILSKHSDLSDPKFSFVLAKEVYAYAVSA